MVKLPWSVWRWLMLCLLPIVAVVVAGLSRAETPVPKLLPQSPASPAPAPLPDAQKVTVTLTETSDVSVYRARKGDTWEKISKAEYGHERCADALREFNRQYPRSSDRLKREGTVGEDERIFLPPLRLLLEKHQSLVRRLEPVAESTQVSPDQVKSDVASPLPVPLDNKDCDKPALKGSVVAPLPVPLENAPAIKTVSATLPACPPPTPSADDITDTPTPDPLITRTVHLNLAGAETILSGSKAKARAMKLSVCIVVADASEAILSFARMDGARDDSFPAVFFGVDKVGVQLAAVRCPESKRTDALHSEPVTVDNQVIGAVRCAGATPEQVRTIARAGIQALHDALKKDN